MSNCRKFIHGINAINFSEAAAKSIRAPLIRYAHEELTVQGEQLSKLLAGLPEDIADNDLANQQLADYKEKLENRIEEIAHELKLIAEKNPAINFNQKIVPPDPEQLITDFATNFRDIKHLTYTLSDAPPFIKSLRIKLCIRVLRELTKAEQEAQFKALDLMTIKNTIVEALSLYEQSPKDPELRTQCQKLVQMAFYELVRSTCEQCPAAKDADKYHVYIQLLRSLNANILPLVGKSDIIDNLSAYRASDRNSIIDLLAGVERTLKIDQAADWEKDEKISALIERKKLLHTLRFGQEDRREYAKKIQENLARDLFWARGIHDANLFTKSTIANDAYLGISVRHYIESNKATLNAVCPLSAKDLKKYKAPEARRLAIVIEKISNACSEQGISKGKAAILSSPNFKAENPIAKTINAAKPIFEEYFGKANVTVNNKLITVDLFYVASPKELTQKMLEVGAFTMEPATMLLYLDKIWGQIGISGTSITGTSIADIRKQFNDKNFPAEAKKAYELQLTKLEQSIPKVTLKDKIKKLQLENEKEVLLGQLLELYNASYDTNNPILKKAYQLLEQEKITEALHLAGIEKTMKEAYKQLAEMDEKKAGGAVKALVTKSKQISLSTEKRAKAAVENLFKANKDAETTAKELSDIFKEEYRAMAPILRLSDKVEMDAEDKLSEMDDKIDDMAKELVLFMERTKEGKPALTLEEEETYFNVIQQIAEAIHPVLIKDVQFKIKHSPEENTLAISIKYPDGTTKIKNIELDDGATLPYSLIKPPGSDFIFSYGGTRGILAPVEGVDAAYSGIGGEKDPFSNSKLVGLGQYGTVKAVEFLLTGLNKVVKKGNVPANDKGSAFTPASVSNPLTRPLTSRDDPLFRTESDVLKWLSTALDSDSSGTIYWIDKDKARPAGALFADAERLQYHLLTDKAKGGTYADTANNLKKGLNSQEIYHDPSQRNGANTLGPLKEMLNLSQAIIAESQKFEALGFAHNDIKPENFLYKKNSDGSYQVSFIDWATGGFEKKYIGKAETAEKIFEDVFGSDLPKKANVAKDEYTDASGRFVRVTANGKVFGINPTLQIVHGARNGTLPYISPSVLKGKTIKAANVVDITQNTKFEASECTMDDWALTAMTFGICNRHSYFTLVKGRIVNDYTIPGILQADDKIPQGLEIVNVAEFNKFFACGAHNLKKKEEAETQKNAVMYIPANPREGEPLHLYRHLTKLLENLSKKPNYANPQSDERAIATRVERILSLAMQKVASGEGFNKAELQSQLAEAQLCLKSYELLNDPDFLKSQSNGKVLQAVFDQNAKKEFTAMTLLVKGANAVSPLEALCTYPTTDKQKVAAISILDKAFSREEVFNNTFVTGKNPPARYLFSECIKQKQDEILISLFSKIKSISPPFVQMVIDDGLLHYAAEQGMTKVFAALIVAIRQAGIHENAILGLLLTEYGPGVSEKKTSTPIKWSANCFHIAIRNNNPEQLALILSLWPKNAGSDEVIKKALHLCAVLGNKALYKQILDKYNQLHPEPAEQLDPEKVLKMTFSPDDTSPYHLFLNDVSPEDPKNDVIPWDVLEENKNRALSTQFLLTPPNGTLAYPLLIAAKSCNITGMRRIVSLGETIELNGEQWATLYRQTDAAGKNVFNYLLEHEQLLDLDVLLTNINANCTNPASVLADLLSTPQPVNALTNYLNAQKDEELQFQVVNQLFDAISLDFNDDKLQHIRLVTLLVNRAWLIDKANHEASHESLSDLLFDNDKLSIDFKRILFTELIKVSQPNSTAQRWFSARLADITAKQPAVNQSVVLGFMPANIALDVAFQETDTSSFLASLKRLGGDKPVNNELEERAALAASEALRLKALADASQQMVENLTAQLATRDALVQQSGVEQAALKNNIAALTTALDDLRLSTTAEIAQLKAAAVEKDAEHQSAIDKQSAESHGTLESTIKNYEDEKATLAAALESARNAASDKAGQLENRIMALTSDLKQKTEAQSALAVSTTQMRHDLQEAAQEKVKLEAALESAQKIATDKATQFENRIAALTAELAQKTLSQTAMADEATKVTQSLQQAVRETQELAATLELARTESSARTKQLQSLVDALTLKLEQVTKSKEEQISALTLTAAKSDADHDAALADQIARAKHELETATIAFNRDRERLQALLEAQKSNNHSELQSTIANLSKEISDLGVSKDTEIGKLKAEIVSSQAKLEEFSALSEQMAGALNAQLAEHQKKMDDQLIQLEAEHQKKMDDQIVQLEAEHTVSNAKAATDASVIIEELRSEKTKLEESLRAAQTAGTASQDQAQTLTSEFKALMKRFEQLTRESQEERLRQVAQDEVYSQLQNQYNAFKADSEQSLASSESEKNNQLRAFQTQNDALRAQLTAIHQQKTVLDTALASATASDSASKSELGVLNGQLLVLRQQFDELSTAHQRILAAEHEKDEALSHFSQLKEVNAQLQATSQQLSESNQKKDEELTLLQQGMRALTLQLTAIKTDFQELVAAVATQNNSDTEADEADEAASAAGEAASEAGEAASEADEAASEADEAASEADEAASAADEAASAADEAASAADEAASEADEAASEADEAASEADEAASNADEAEAGVNEVELQTGPAAGAHKPAQGNPILANKQSWTTIKNKNTAMLKEIMAGVAPLSKMKHTLESLSSTSMIWLNPAFQDSAKHYALELTQNFHELAKNTDLLIPYLRNQIDKLSTLLNAIPDDDELQAIAYQDEVIEHRTSLERSLQDLETYLATQIRLQKQLRGNKDKETLLEKQGLLATIEQALNEKKDLRQLPGLYTITYVDYPLADKATYLAGLPKNAKVSSMEVNLPKDHYQTVNRVEADCFRVHKLAVGKKELGEFIEERPIVDNNTKTTLKLSIVSFPDADHSEDRVIYSMAIVTQLLASLKAAPTARKPIVLKGDNLEELHYLWTSLMVISAKAGLGFDRHSIKVNNTTFDSKTEFDESTGQYSPTSYYKKYFENSAQLTTLVNHTKHLMTDKLGYQSEHKKAQEHSASALGLFREKMSGTLRKTEDGQDEPGPRQK